MILLYILWDIEEVESFLELQHHSSYLILEYYYFFVLLLLARVQNQPLIYYEKWIMSIHSIWIFHLIILYKWETI